MDITKTSNIYILLAEGQCRAGDDMEEVAKNIATAFKVVVDDGLGKSDPETVIAELKFLLGYDNDEHHRQQKDL